MTLQILLQTGLTILFPAYIYGEKERPKHLFSYNFKTGMLQRLIYKCS